MKDYPLAKLFEVPWGRNSYIRVKKELRILREKFIRHESTETQKAVWYDLIAFAHEAMLQSLQAGRARAESEQYVAAWTPRGPIRVTRGIRTARSRPIPIPVEKEPKRVGGKGGRKSGPHRKDARNSGAGVRPDGVLLPA